MNIVIGDVHGEVTKLDKLINTIFRRYSNPNIFFIGDYLDKGEDVYATLKYIGDLLKKCSVTLLYGNHEYIWERLHERKIRDIDILQYLTKYGGMMTLKSFNVDNFFVAKDIILSKFPWFFESLVPHATMKNYVMLHSGISPSDFNKEIDDITLENKLFNRYLFIENTNLYQNKYKIIFGHTGFYTPYVDETKIGIDTSACFLEGQPLTAFCIEEEIFINSAGAIKKLNDFSLNTVPLICRNKPWRSC